MGDLSTRYPSTWRGVPAAMPGGDYGVWKLFLDLHGNEWSDYAYDIELHGNTRPIIDPDPALTRLWSRVTAKRIDAIGFRASGLTLFEVRHNAAWQSLGQLLGYRELFALDYPTEQIEQSIILTDAIDAAIRATAERYGLKIMLIT